MRSVLPARSLRAAGSFHGGRKMVHLRPVTKDNLDAVLALKVNEHQTRFVSSVAESMAQAYVYADTAFPFAVEHDGDTVGFIMMGYYEEKHYYTLWKLLIDRRFQGMGYGRKALELGVAFLRERSGVREVYTGVLPDNHAAKSLYQSVGFEETGLFENGMQELRLAVPPAVLSR